MTGNEHPNRNAPSSAARMSAQDLLLWGLGDVVYVRRVEAQGEILYGVFAADGSEVALARGRGEAFLWARRQGLEPVSAH